MAGIYIHIPFCKQACHYCNFHFSTSLKNKGALIAALTKEIALTPINQKLAFVTSLYWGGGSPSILSSDDLKIIFDALHKKFVFDKTIEITLEANPDDITDLKLQQWKALGINRLSVGIQSFSDKELKAMNRAHNATQSLICIDKIKAAGFTNFSIDLIYGSPLLTNKNWKKNIQIAIDKNIPHLSCYALTVEPKTALNKMIALNKIAPLNAEKQAQQFLLLMQWMNEAGYQHYEISNFAKPHFKSLHNSSYWTGNAYYGFGPSAHSFDGNRRWWNIANNALYIKSLQNNTIPFEEEILTPTQKLNEYIMTSIRTQQGINLDFIAQKFGEQFSHQLQTKCNKFINSNKLLTNNGNCVLTQQGKLFADGIAVDLFF